MITTSKTETLIKQGRWIYFVKDNTYSGTTQRVIVYDHSFVRLGVIKWYGPWRKYVWYPNNGTLYEEVCMREISDFIENLTKDHKNGKAT